MSCVMKYCYNYRTKTNKAKSNITYHKFPVDILMKERWTKATGHDANWSPNPRSAVCSEHFTKESFTEISGRKCLKPDTVPTEKLTQCDEPSTNVKSFGKATNGLKKAVKRPHTATRPRPQQRGIRNKMEGLPSEPEIKASPSSCSVSYQYLVEQVDSIPMTNPGSTVPVIKQERNQFNVELISTEPENSSSAVLVKQEQNNVDSISTTNPGNSNTTVVVKKEQNIVDPVSCSTTTTEMLIAKLRWECKRYQNLAASRKKRIKIVNQTLRRANKKIQTMADLLATLQ